MYIPEPYTNLVSELGDVRKDMGNVNHVVPFIPKKCDTPKTFRELKCLSRLPIENQTLTIWPKNHFDLDMTLTLFVTLTSDNSN